MSEQGECEMRTILPVQVEAGHRYGRGVVTDPDAGRRSGHRLARLACDCGQIYEATHSRLRSGRTQSCGCLRRDHAAANSAAQRLVPPRPGERFGRGIVTDPDAGRGPSGDRLVRLRCDCGAEYTTTISYLRAGRVQSCGCLIFAHGLSRHPLYKIWQAMLRRCEDPASRQYPSYGGRGITVWDPWHDVARFIADVEAEIGPRPPGKHPNGRARWTLDRTDNNSGYSPGNIRWATVSDQNRNRRAWRLTPAASSRPAAVQEGCGT